jgi:DNA-binding MarR family transcriptional regulator
MIKKNINIDGASFQRVTALSIVPTDGIEMSSLASRLGIDNSTATRLIIGMEKIGWVDRRSSTLDKRVVQVYLTSEGFESQIDLEKQLNLIGKEVELNLNPLEKQKMIDHISHLSWILLKLSINK